MEAEFTLVIDSVRSVQVNSNETGGIVLTVEDAQSISIVEMNRDETKQLLNDLVVRMYGEEAEKRLAGV